MNTGKEKSSETDKTTGLPSAAALDAASLVNYADGAIVSRIIADSGGGSVTLFAFDAAQSLSEHTAPFDALVHVIEGETELTIEGRPVRASAGQLVVMPANVPHAVKAITRFKMLLIMLRSRD